MNLEEIENMLPIEAIKAICVPGKNDEAVEEWESKLNGIRLTKKQCIEILLPYWIEKELKRDLKKQLKEKVIWLAAWNVFEREEI